MSRYCTDIGSNIANIGSDIGKKIRDTELSKVPYMLIIGEKEMQEEMVSVRRQGKGDMGTVKAADFIASAVEEIRERRSV